MISEKKYVFDNLFFADMLLQMRAASWLTSRTIMIISQRVCVTWNRDFPTIAPYKALP